MRVSCSCFAAHDLIANLKVSLAASVAISIAALVLSNVVYADNVINFYEHNSAKTTFAEEAAPTATPELGYAPARVSLKVDANSAQTSDTFQIKHPASQDSLSGNTKISKDSDDDVTKNTATRTMTREEIIKAFGSPDGDLPVNGVDNAPQPFKAVQRALELGDDQLAYEYAKQYVKYIRKVGDRSNQIGQLMSQVMKNEKAKEAQDKEVDNDNDKLTDMALQAMHPVADLEQGGGAYER